MASHVDTDGHEQATARPLIMGEPLAFDTAEYSARIDRTRDVLRSEGLDALLLFHQENMYYLFGYDQLGYWVYQTAVLPADGPGIHMLCREADEVFVAGLPKVEDARLWHDDSPDDPATMTVDLLKGLGFANGQSRIGIELQSHALLPFYYEKLRRELADRCELVDASTLVSELRLCKSPSEIAYVRRAAEVLDASYEKAFAAIRPGSRESDVLAAALDGMFAAGGDVPAIVPPTASGPRTLSGTHGAAVDRVLGENELFCIEIGGCFRRYHAVGVQSKWLGTPPRKAKEAHERLLETLEAGVASALPGTRVADVARVFDSALARHAMQIPGNHFGYGTGIGYPPTWLDHLRVKERDRHVLEPGMLLFLFVYHTLAGPDGQPVTIFIGEPVLVTTQGNERLSGVPIDLDL